MSNLDKSRWRSRIGGLWIICFIDSSNWHLVMKLICNLWLIIWCLNYFIWRQRFYWDQINCLYGKIVLILPWLTWNMKRHTFSIPFINAADLSRLIIINTACNLLKGHPIHSFWFFYSQRLISIYGTRLHSDEYWRIRTNRRIIFRVVIIS